MKKTLWTLSAIALLGLGAYACGGEDECDPTECAAGQECISDLLGGSHCGWFCGEDCGAKSQECVRSTKQCMNPCPDGQVRDPEDGLCISGTTPGACTSKAQCEANQDCVGGECVEVGSADPVFKYVRIDDMSKNTTGREDPGADIDTIVLKKKATNEQILPTNVVYYVRADGTKAQTDRSVAADPEIVKQISSFVSYPNIDDCHLYTKESDPKNKDSRQYAYVSLGGQKDGQSGILIVEMGGSIEDGDTLDVLEVGNCNLQNTESGKSTKAINDPVTVYVSVSEDLESNNWKLVHTASDSDKGVISIPIKASDLQ